MRYDNELMDRVIRLESRLVQLGDYVGANLRHKQRIEIVRREGYPVVVIDALDVSLSRIRKELQARLTLDELAAPIDVMLNGHLVAVVYCGASLG